VEGGKRATLHRGGKSVGHLREACARKQGEVKEGRHLSGKIARERGEGHHRSILMRRPGGGGKMTPWGRWKEGADTKGEMEASISCRSSYSKRGGREQYSGLLTKVGGGRQEEGMG